jgi:hypothetical protein
MLVLEEQGIGVVRPGRNAPIHRLDIRHDTGYACMLDLGHQPRARHDFRTQADYGKVFFSSR